MAIKKGKNPSKSSRTQQKEGKALTITEKILASHLVEGDLMPGTPIAIHIDQTLTQDATGTMAWLQFEALGIERVKTDISLSYIDHNTLQTGFENADDHAFLQSIAQKYGAVFSKPGNGICHQVHLERFGRPGATLLGSDSHTPTGGGIGMIAIGAGGLDVAASMGGAPFYLQCPEIMKIYLTGRLRPTVSAKDIILEVLRRLTVKGGVNKILEYAGPGVRTLSVPERATITNMGAETGATTSVFPADEITAKFLAFQSRRRDFRPVTADAGAVYSGGEMEINLSQLKPMAAKPHSPDAGVPITEIAGLKVQQVVIGSCTNSSLADMLTVAGMLAGKKVHPYVSLVISPGSQQVVSALAKSGALEALISAGARVMEPACGACIGMGQAPASGAITLRTFNRNFQGRSGTPDAKVYLVSPETAAAAALKGEITDPRKLKPKKKFVMPKKADISDSLLVFPSPASVKTEIIRGPNIAPLPVFPALAENDSGKVLAKFGDNITTDDIMPAGAKILPLRSNIPAIAQYVFSGLDPNFVKRSAAEKGGYVVGGENYGQGSSREHAALAPRYLGVRAVLAKSFARIHFANLVNFGILPLTFINPEDYDSMAQEHILSLPNIKKDLESGRTVQMVNITTGKHWEMQCRLTEREVKILLAGGMLNFLKTTLNN